MIGAHGICVTHFIKEHFQLECKGEVILNNQYFEWCQRHSSGLSSAQGNVEGKYSAFSNLTAYGERRLIEFGKLMGEMEPQTRAFFTSGARLCTTLFKEEKLF